MEFFFLKGTGSDYVFNYTPLSITGLTLRLRSLNFYVSIFDLVTRGILMFREKVHHGYQSGKSR